jgi:hypothetical protein
MGVVTIVFRVAVVLAVVVDNGVVVVAAAAAGGFVVLGVYRPHLPRPKYSNPRTQNHEEFSTYFLLFTSRSRTHTLSCRHIILE